MATSTELLRAAEHMRLVSARMERDGACDIMRAEAARLQAVEAQQAQSYCSDAVSRYDGREMLVEETRDTYAMRFKANPDNSLHLGKNCTQVTSERFLLGLCREVVRPIDAQPKRVTFAVLRRAPRCRR